MIINCIVVEDEPLALERAKSYISKIPFLKLSSVFDNAHDALVYLKTNKVDLIFLDINLGELSGIELLEGSDIKSEVIIITAYDQYALKGFDLNVTDYLLKPFTFERFILAVERAKENLSRHENQPGKKFLFLKTGYRLEKILLNEILFIEGMGDYRRVHTVNKKIMTLQTFKEFEEQFPATAICRVHKSYMVSIDKINIVEKDSIKIGNVTIPISETYKKEFFALINKSQ